jgi:hypothetical protein
MNIYTSTRVLPYVYRLDHKETGQFYIGYRCANKVPSSSDLGFEYFTSSKVVKNIGFNNFNYCIIAEFLSKEDAREFEIKLISEHWINPLKLNKCIGGFTFACSGPCSEETRKKIGDTHRGKPKSEECKQKLSKLNKGKILGPHSEEHKQKMSESLKGMIKSEEHKQKISKTLKGRSTGPKSDEHKMNLRKPKEKVMCPYCGKIGGISSMSRWHFNNCRTIPPNF